MVGEFFGMAKKALFKCDCGHEWMAQPNNIRNGSGCPACAFGNVHGKAKGWVYVALINGEVKIGSTSNPKGRMHDLHRKTGKEIKPIAFFVFGDGSGPRAFEAEKKAQTFFKDKQIHKGKPPFEGAKELFMICPIEACDFLTKIGGQIEDVLLN